LSPVFALAIAFRDGKRQPWINSAAIVKVEDLIPFRPISTGCTMIRTDETEQDLFGASVFLPFCSPTRRLVSVRWRGQR
jgi:hypothetical protein